MNKTTEKKQTSSFMNNMVKRPEFSILVILVVMITLTALLQKNFFSIKSIVRNINAFTPLILLTMGQAVVIIAGGIDLSAGPALSLLTCVLTFIMKEGSPVTGVYALVITFAAAVLLGIINGIGIGYLRIPPVIATFATSFMWLGTALFIRPTPGGETVNWFNAFYSFRSLENVPQVIRTIGDIIPPALVLVLLGCFFWYILSRTRTGRYIYAVGSSLESAYESGIDTALVQTSAYIINSVFIFLTALFFVGQNQSGDARLGDPLTLRAIAAAVVGGIALSGGKGSVFFAIVGALILSFVNKIIFFADIPYAFQTLVGGVIVIGAIASSRFYTIYNQKVRKKESSLI
ncbi:MAG: ABC transporter permease [Spirochaetales bacterium]|nr:ABC transporter permease [Spirochaetales bacterium]